MISYNILRSGRSSVWLERYLGVVEVARSSRVAPTKKPVQHRFIAVLYRFSLFLKAAEYERFLNYLKTISFSNKLDITSLLF